MHKNNNAICNNIFRTKDSKERKKTFTQKISDLINQTEHSSPVSICEQANCMYNEKRADRLVFIESPNAQRAMRKRGDKT